MVDMQCKTFCIYILLDIENSDTKYQHTYKSYTGVWFLSKIFGFIEREG